MGKKHAKLGISSNISWTVQKGSSIAHVVITGLITLLFTKTFGKNKGLQLALIFYNFCSFLFFHWIIGDPFNAKFREFTFWEQMQAQLEDSSSLTFLSIFPIVLFFAVHRIVEWEKSLFIISSVTLLFVVVPKLGFMHMKRIFGIKRYD